MARYVEGFIQEKGIHLVLNDGAAGFREADNGGLETLTKSEQVFPADVVVIGIKELAAPRRY